LGSGSVGEAIEERPEQPAEAEGEKDEDQNEGEELGEGAFEVVGQGEASQDGKGEEGLGHGHKAEHARHDSREGRERAGFAKPGKSEALSCSKVVYFLAA
jgi:hypothetical protein